MDPRDLLRIAEMLASGALGEGRGRPRQSELRRAVSTAYYALFHLLAACCADLLIGASPAVRRGPAWERAYRALGHGFARDQFRNAAQMRQFSRPLLDFADLFVLMQSEREKADYNPNVEFLRFQVLQLIAESRQKIDAFDAVPSSERRAFAAHALLRAR